MKSYTLTQISGSNYTVYLDGTILTAAQFKTAFLDNAGTAEFTSSVATSGVTLWDSAEMTGNSISTTEAIEANTPYNGAWSAVIGVTTNTFTSFLKATGKTLTDYQLSALAKIAKEGKVREIDLKGQNYNLSTASGIKINSVDCGFYKITNSGASARLYVGQYWYLDVGNGATVMMFLGQGTNGMGWGIYTATGTGALMLFATGSSDNKYNLFFPTQVQNNLTSMGTAYPLSAYQGKVLKGLIDTLDAKVVNFTGTDGTNAGTAGLVPAPATTDADKFLKSDGTWGEAGGGGIPTNATFWGRSYDSTSNKVEGNIYLGGGGRYIMPYSAASSNKIGFNGYNRPCIMSSNITFLDITHIAEGSRVSNRLNLYNLNDPTSAQDAATKHYVDTLVGDIETALNTINNGGGN